MANTKKVYTIEIDGVKTAIELAEKFNRELEELETQTEQQAEANKKLTESTKETTKAQEENTEANKEAQESTEALNELMDEFGGETLNQLRNGLTRARAGVLNFGKSLKTVSGIAKGIGIGLLISALATLSAFFTSSREGALQFEKIIASLTATFQVLVGDLIKVGKFLSSIRVEFNDFGIPTFKADTEALSGAFQNLGQRIETNVEKTIALKQAQFDLRETQRELTLQTARLNAEQERLQAIADDDTISLQEQAEASQRVRNIAEKRLGTEIKLAQERLDIANKELEIARTNGQESDELLDAQLEAQTQLIEAEKELNVFRIENNAFTRRIQRDSFEQDLDFAIDLFDKQKTINEQQIADDKKSFEEREQLLARTVELSESAYAEQTKLVEDFTGKQIDFNSLIEEDDQKVVVERLKGYKLDEITTKRILEIIKERKQVVQDLALIEEEINQDRIDYNKRLEKAEDDLELSRIERRARREKDEAEQLELQIKAIEKRTEIALKNEELLQDERTKIIEASLEEIQNLREGYDEKQKELDQKNLEARKEQLSQIADLGKELLQASLQLLDTLFEASIQRREERLLEAQERVQFAEESLEESRNRTEELNNEIKESTGARREFLVEQIEAEEKAEKKLEREKEKAKKQELKRLAELEKEKRKQANIQFGIDLAEAISSGALAIARILASTAVDPTGTLRAIQIAIVSATTALQVATISAQQGKFAKGGFTGSGYGSPDETGFKQAGIVHEGEYVVPKRIVESSRGASLINSLENMRLQKYAEGGFVGANFGQATLDLQQGDLIGELRLLRAETSRINQAPVQVVATEVAEVNSRVASIQEKATI